MQSMSIVLPKGLLPRLRKKSPQCRLLKNQNRGRTKVCMNINKKWNYQLSSQDEHADIELEDLSSIHRGEAADERELVRRLDKRLLAFAMFGNMVKALDNSNLGSAFISGMEEELHITGLQYNWMGVLFMIGYLSMQIPSNIMLARLRPSVYLPFLEVIWCLLTISMACVQSVQGVYMIRILLGLAEAGFYPGIVFLISTWYSKKELGKRLALVTICGSLGSGMSGVIQAVMLKTMDKVMGISGWRWMFLFDATVTAVLAVFGYYILPDYPSNTSWLNKKERSLAVRRSDTTGKPSKSDGGQRMSKVRELIRNKFLYLFMIGWATLHISLGTPLVLGIVSKKLGFTAITANLLTTPDMLITMLAGLCNGYISDQCRTRIWCIVIPATVALLGCIMLSSFVQPFGWLYAAFILAHSGLSSSTSVTMTWANEIISNDIEIRAMAIATMSTSASLMWLWSPLVLWPVTDAPRYHTGFTISALSLMIFILSMVIVARLVSPNPACLGKDNDTTVIPLLQDEVPDLSSYPSQVQHLVGEYDKRD